MRSLFDRFLPMFIETAQKRLVRAQALANSCETTAFAHELHALAGEAGVLGLSAIATSARDAEAFARTADENSIGHEGQEHVQKLTLLLAELKSEG